MTSMPAVAPRPERKHRDAYHHGNLRQALVDQTVALIRDRGVEAVTLREVGARLRVSRTALYRHFSDKAGLLAAVATEGFRSFHGALLEAWTGAGRGAAGFERMGQAYVRFALDNPAHYRVMFGGFGLKAACDPDLAGVATSAFQLLVDAIAELQAAGVMRRDDPQRLARFVWASVHGLSMLAIDGQLGPPGSALQDLATATVADIQAALAAR